MFQSYFTQIIVDSTNMPNLTYILNFTAPNVIKPGAN